MIAEAALALAQCAAAPLLPNAPWAGVDAVELRLAEPQSVHADAAGAPPACGGFDLHQGEVNLGIEDATAWLRFRLPREVRQPRLLVRFGGLSSLCAHWPLRDGYRIDCIGDPQAGVQRVRQGFLLRPPRGLEPAGHVYLAARSSLWLKLPMEFGSADGLASAEHAGQLIWGLYFGLLLGVATLGLVTFSGQRDVVYLYFSGHVAGLALAIALWQGRLTAWDVPGLSSIALAPALIGLSLAAGAVFYRDFLGTRSALPRIHFAFSLLAGLCLALAVAVLVVPVAGSLLLGAAALAWIALAVVSAVLRAWRGSRSAGYLLAGLSVLLLALLANALQVLGVPVLGARATNQLLYLGALSSALFLVLAIAQRIRALALERDQATRLLARMRSSHLAEPADDAALRAVEDRLPAALRNDELVLHYQPLLSLREGRVAGAEALLRWPGAGIPGLRPPLIIDAAAHCGMTEQISDHVLRAALDQLARWQDAGIHVPRVSVNFGAEGFHEARLPSRVAAALAGSGISGSRLRLEITEHTLVHDLAQARRIIEQIRELGVGVWVDDFGAGYSSLNYLRTLPVSGVKLDRVFLQDYPQDAAASRMIRAMVALVRDLGLDLVVEGVETPAQHQELWGEGDLLAQGFHYAEPMAPADFSVWLRGRLRQAA